MNQRKTQTEILEYLAEHHPELHSVAEIERDWLWLPVHLRGEENRPIREDLKMIGFRFAKHGHTLPSGAVGTWGHSCMRPMPFKRRGGGKEERGSGEERADLSDNELLAMLG